ncbi:MAG TPA: histidine kinase dimerization/phospho-acceptor domain-containing protein, partial [Longimicrobiaceae bacterium]|nr:histidine kinase dimerization/phospho-acceptor domain-containing protein [Longimicrobiaceae bacterium]
MSRARPPSLRQEIVRGYTAILLVALTLFAAATYLILKRSLASTGTQSLRQTAQAAEQLIIPAEIPRMAVEEERLPPAPGDVEALRRRTRLATGEVVNIYVARTGDVEQKALRSFAVIALLLIPVTGVAAAVVGYTVANRLLQPLNRLVAASREIGIAGLSRRVDVPQRPAELRELSQSFNGMLQRLERAVEALRSFTADASHELRTPLTAIRGTAEVALARERPPGELRETLVEVLEETDSMLHLVEDLLTLARGDQSVAPLRETVDLAPVLRDVQDIGEALAAGKPVQVRLDAPAALAVTGSPGPLRRLFLNLVSNAVKFTDAGVVTITARAVEAEAGAGDPSAGEGRRWVEVSVADSGCGIAAEALPRVFDRFYRADAAREHSGG